jgi:hypothetical protein
VRHSTTRLAAYGIGSAIGFVAKYYVIDHGAIDPWRFVLGITIPSAFFIASSYFRQISRRTTVLVGFVLAILFVFKNARNVALTCMLTSAYLLLRISRHIPRRRTLLFAVGWLVITAIGLSQFYSFGASNGWFGTESYRKYQLQSQGSGGVILGGRTEILASSQAVIDSPFIGHGSWPHDPKYGAILGAQLNDFGYNMKGDADANGLIPTHSYLFQAWVWAGILGAVFWAWAFWLVARALLMASGQEAMFEMCVYTGFAILWDILFSPFGANVRFTSAYAIYALIFLHRETVLIRKWNIYV